MEIWSRRSLLQTDLYIHDCEKFLLCSLYIFYHDAFRLMFSDACLACLAFHHDVCFAFVKIFLNMYQTLHCNTSSQLCILSKMVHVKYTNRLLTNHIDPVQNSNCLCKDKCRDIIAFAAAEMRDAAEGQQVRPCPALSALATVHPKKSDT